MDPKDMTFKKAEIESTEIKFDKTLVERLIESGRVHGNIKVSVEFPVSGRPSEVVDLANIKDVDLKTLGYMFQTIWNLAEKKTEKMFVIKFDHYQRVK